MSFAENYTLSVQKELGFRVRVSRAIVRVRHRVYG